MKNIKIIIAFLLISTNLMAQIEKCGTIVPKNYANFISALQSDKSYTNLDCINKILSISVHLTSPDTSRMSPNISIPTSIQSIYDAIDTLNTFFKPICLSFRICSVDTIVNTDYYELNDLSDYHNLLTTNNNISSTINMYFVNLFIPTPNKGGEATMPNPDNCNENDGHIYIKYESIGNGRTIPHEMGHYFGLLHTFADGELVNGSNCTTAGDLICDTNADPDTSGSMVDSDCHFTGTQKDINGDYYIPPVSNIMSYYGSCVCRFTHEQYQRMVLVYNSCRKYLK